MTLESQPERRLIRERGSFRHVTFSIGVVDADRGARPRRTPVTIALVLDRSGSMSGDKLPTAKVAALAVLDSLDERDRVSVVVFDTVVEVVQPVAPATAETKRRIAEQLAHVEARASTALHEGWLVGCKSIASDGAQLPSPGLPRCFLLTDGQANVGTTDPEQIATQVAGVRANAGIGTSTFGIGRDYNESLLGPMAVAGGGQFHHLRSAEEIVNTFVGELGELLSVAAGHLRLELDGGGDITAEAVSSYRVDQPLPGISKVSVAIGDLPAGQERHVVVRFGFPTRSELAERTIMARLVWSADGQERATAWQEMRFAYADHAACDAELRAGRDPQAMHWVGLHHAERAKRLAAELSRRGDLPGARHMLEAVATRIDEYVGSDPDLKAAASELRRLVETLATRVVDPAAAKEMHYQAHRVSREQADYRGRGPGGAQS